LHIAALAFWGPVAYAPFLNFFFHLRSFSRAAAPVSALKFSFWSRFLNPSDLFFKLSMVAVVRAIQNPRFAGAAD